ncbi:MAG: TetR/AcrR family transcriptional regulator [Actinobacteria bacterium]|nr:MAG: TetR/AcrR family transcriptional regulator [Actinomycetota bacterium]
MIQSALILMGERGIEATSFSQVIEHSGAPRGSIYHHFPGGKSQLVEEATRYAGDTVAKLLGQAVEEAEDPVAAIDTIVNFWRTVMYNSDFAAGCPVIAATLEGDHSPAARAAAKDVFQRWEELYAEMLQRAGIPEERARSLGSIAISAVEGAVILSRAERSNGPLERVADELQRLFHGALEDARTQ